MHPKISNLTPPMLFRIFKNRNKCESPIHQEASKQNFIRIGRETKTL